MSWPVAVHSQRNSCLTSECLCGARRPCQQQPAAQCRRHRLRRPARKLTRAHTGGCTCQLFMCTHTHVASSVLCVLEGCVRSLYNTVGCEVGEQLPFCAASVQRVLPALQQSKGFCSILHACLSALLALRPRGDAHVHAFEGSPAACTVQVERRGGWQGDHTSSLGRPPHGVLAGVERLIVFQVTPVWWVALVAGSQ